MDLSKILGGLVQYCIKYGKNKQDGSHDHRFDRKGDRTPAQKAGDTKRKNEKEEQ